MTKKRSTKSALISSVLALFLCVSMLVGTTFAWFTDSVSTEMNKIVAGNLDIELDWTTDAKVGTSSLADDAVWSEVEEDTNIFGDSYWEPGHTEVVYLRIKNAGSLALRYRLNINVANEVPSTNVYDEEFYLSSYIEYAVLSVTAAYGTREAARAAIPENGAMPLDVAYAPERADLYPADNTPANKVSETIVALVVYMPEDVGNEANFAKGYNPPEVYLGINLAASQLEYEDDSYGDDYDAKADLIYADGEIANIDSEFTGNIENNGTLNVTAPVTGNIENNGTLNVTAPVTGNIDNNGKLDVTAPINGGVKNNGKLVIENTTITNKSGAGLANYSGEATITNSTVNAGTSGEYVGIQIGEDVKAVYNEVQITSAGGGISVRGGADAVFNSGKLHVATTASSGRYNFYATGEGSTITINGGVFSFSTASNTRRAYIYAEDGATVYVNGGTFGKASTRSGYNTGFMTAGTGSIIVTGGTFGFNPTNWVAAGHQAVYDATAKTWTVIKGETVANDNASLNDALANGNDKIFLNAGNYSMPTTTGDVSIYGTADTEITINKPQAENVTIEGVTVIGSGNYTGIQHSKKVVYKDCVVKGVQFLYADEVEFINCTIDLTATPDYIWTYGAKNVTFDNCTFNTAGKALLIYSEGADLVTNVTVKNCTFNATASALAGGKTAAAIEIDSSLSANGHYTLTTENNTVDSDFSGEWRIKKSATDNVTVNGVVYNAITIDGVVQE